MSNFNQYNNNWNPFAAMVRGESVIANQVARKAAKTQQERATQGAISIIAANHQATTLHTEQQAKIAEEAAASAHARSQEAAAVAHGRRQEFFTSAMKHVAPGSKFSVNIDGQTISGVKRAGTKRTPAAPATPMPAPIKKKTPPRARTPKG
jgi:hypothetical protein